MIILYLCTMMCLYVGFGRKGRNTCRDTDKQLKSLVRPLYLLGNIIMLIACHREEKARCAYSSLTLTMTDN